MDRPASVDQAGAARIDQDLQAELICAAEGQWRARTDPTIIPEDEAAAQRRAQTTQLREKAAGRRPDRPTATRR
jgi:hypothetical protein